MPKKVNPETEAYDKEYDAFLKQLEEFHQQRGTTFKRLPRINGKGIDLYLLYVVVTARGGWQKVNARNEWDEILEDFRLPQACVNATTALKHIYIRYLDTYERVHFLGEDGDERITDGDDEESRSMRCRRAVRALNTVPMSYNHQQHVVQESARVSSGMSTDVYKSSAYDRLGLSLVCPLPNEHDFAFNTCTLLSNEGKHTIQLSHCPKLIDCMLAHAGIFRDFDTQKYVLMSYKEAKGRNLLQFWVDSVEDKSVLDLLIPEGSVSVSLMPLLGVCVHNRSFNSDVVSDIHRISKEIDQLNVSSYCETVAFNEEEKCSEHEDSNSGSTVISLGTGGGSETAESVDKKLEALGCDGVDLKLDPGDSEIFHLGRDIGLLDSEGTRITQVLHILRNLSFEEYNVHVLAQSTTCLRFLVLCICSRWGGLAVGALDTLGNIASEVTLVDPAVDPTSSLMLTTICQGVSSQDRAFVLRSLEILNKLAVNDPNEEVLCSNIDQAVYDQLCRFLTIHDIMLLIYTLECLYSLSSLGTPACNAIVRCKGSIQTLVSLLTVEAQSYGPDACIGMKVVETVTGVVTDNETSPTSSGAAQAVTAAAPAGANSSVVNAGTPTIVMGATSTVVQTTTVAAPKVEPKKVPIRVVPPEVEEFVIDWVTRNYEACPSNAIEQAIVYRHFASSMHNLGRKQGLNPVLLSNCVRKVFGTGVGPSRRGVEDGSEKWHYNGIRRREVALPPGSVDRKKLSSINSTPTPTPVITSSTFVSRPGTPAWIKPNNVLQVQAADMCRPVSQGSILKAQLSAPLRQPSPPPPRPTQQVSRNIQKQQLPEGQGTHDSMVKKNPNFNGLINEFKNEGASSVLEGGDTKRLNFEGVLVNGLKEDAMIKDEQLKPDDQESDVGKQEKKNLLADLIEKTVGGDILNGVVEKEIKITDRNIQIVSNLTQVVGRPNGPLSTCSNGQLVYESAHNHGIKRPGTPDVGNAVKRLAVDDQRAGAADSRITLYVSQNGSEDALNSQGHQVILSHGQQQATQYKGLPSGQIVSSPLASSAQGASHGQTIIAPQGQVILQRSSQGGVILHSAPQIISQGAHAQVIPSSTQGQIITSGASTSQVVPHNVSGQQVIQQVVQHGTGGQKVILHGGQIGQVIGGQVILPQGQSVVVQGTNNLPSQVFVQSVTSGQNPVIVQGNSTQGGVFVQGGSGQGQVLVQGPGGQGQVLVQGAGTQGQVLVQGSSGQGTVIVQGSGTQNPIVVQGSGTQNPIVVSAVSQGQTLMVPASQGQVVVTSSTGGQVILAGNQQAQPGQVVVQGNHVGNTVFLAQQQQGPSCQKTLIILPNPKMVVAGTSNQNQVVLPRQVGQHVVQVVSASTTTPVSTTTIRTVRTSVAQASASVTPSGSVVSSVTGVQVHPSMSTSPTGPVATPIPQSSTQSVPHVPAPQVLASGVARRQKPSGLQYLCEWRGCNQVFTTPSQVYHHACKVHCPPTISELQCQWVGCDTMIRKRFSLMTHIHDRHCSESLLHILALRRQQVAATGKTDIPVPQTPPPHPGYAPNAAFHAIKRHALEVINQRDAVEKEGPVTKSIRLTAALILRNLVIYSNQGKKLLRGYESELANVAISAMESSRTVSQILYDIHLPDHQGLL